MSLSPLLVNLSLCENISSVSNIPPPHSSTLSQMYSTSFLLKSQQVPRILRLSPEIGGMFSDAMDLFTLTNWRLTCKTNYDQAVASLRRSLTKMLEPFVPKPPVILNIIGRHRSVLGGEFALAFILRDPSVLSTYLDIYSTDYEFKPLCASILDAPTIRAVITSHEYVDLGAVEALRTLVCCVLIIQTSLGTTIRVHRSYTSSATAPLSHSSCTALSNFVTEYGFGCSHPLLTFQRRALIADQELPNLPFTDQETQDRLILRGFSLAFSPIAWREFRLRARSGAHDGVLPSLTNDDADYDGMQDGISNGASRAIALGCLPTPTLLDSPTAFLDGASDRGDDAVHLANMAQVGQTVQPVIADHGPTPSVIDSLTTGPRSLLPKDFVPSLLSDSVGYSVQICTPGTGSEPSLDTAHGRSDPSRAHSIDHDADTALTGGVSSPASRSDVERLLTSSSLLTGTHVSDFAARDTIVVFPDSPHIIRDNSSPPTISTTLVPLTSSECLPTDQRSTREVGDEDTIIPRASSVSSTNPYRLFGPVQSLYGVEDNLDSDVDDNPVNDGLPVTLVERPLYLAEFVSTDGCRVINTEPSIIYADHPYPPGIEPPPPPTLPALHGIGADNCVHSRSPSPLQISAARTPTPDVPPSSNDDPAARSVIQPALGEDSSAVGFIAPVHTSSASDFSFDDSCAPDMRSTPIIPGDVVGEEHIQVNSELLSNCVALPSPLPGIPDDSSSAGAEDTELDVPSSEYCFRDLYLCPSQGRYFGDPGSFVDFFDPLRGGEEFCAHNNVAPFGPMVIWRVLSTFNCEQGCDVYDDAIDAGVPPIPVLIRRNPFTHSEDIV